ncbi:predicted protein [Histoplasma mississippiense (nom. inval.)]|uniref:predicted protein n=1 Tax=Ajellomyces capsulatus (strain NAm1 / WU24) TaxID=2059318 RepID=UPI000157B732|nr:predicted protein [Histoplasma mississippiense (nom. inval.)]EDN03660.1 predicted protein [Histoplasma mississippiense (nom. inval.)]
MQGYYQKKKEQWKGKAKEEKGGLNTPKNRRITRRSKSEQSETDLSLDIKFKLSNGVTITGLGFGTVANECTKGESYAAALHTLGTGHRHLDCYLWLLKRKINNVKGPDIWVTTKVWNHLYDKDGVQWSLNDSLKKLNLDYVGLFLIHWPISCEKAYSEYPFALKTKCQRLVRRWLRTRRSRSLQKNVVTLLVQVLPKSANPGRIESNLEEIKLTDEQQKEGMRGLCEHEGHLWV